MRTILKHLLQEMKNNNQELFIPNTGMTVKLQFIDLLLSRSKLHCSFVGHTLLNSVLSIQHLLLLVEASFTFFSKLLFQVQEKHWVDPKKVMLLCYVIRCN